MIQLASTLAIVLPFLSSGISRSSLFKTWLLRSSFEPAQEGSRGLKEMDRIQPQILVRKHGRCTTFRSAVSTVPRKSRCAFVMRLISLMTVASALLQFDVVPDRVTNERKATFTYICTPLESLDNCIVEVSHELLPGLKLLLDAVATRVL